MKKSLYFLLILLITISSFMVPKPASADMSLLSAMVKKEATAYCDSLQSAIVEPTSNSSNDIDSGEATTDSYSASNFGTQTGTTAQDSSVIMSNERNKNYGYCHIYKLHMEKSNGG